MKMTIEFKRIRNQNDKLTTDTERERFYPSLSSEKIISSLESKKIKKK